MGNLILNSIEFMNLGNLKIICNAKQIKNSVIIKNILVFFCLISIHKLNYLHIHIKLTDIIWVQYIPELMLLKMC